MTTFTTFTDLQTWVGERVGELETPSNVDLIADAILDRDGFPNWGEDCTEFLDALPNDLSTLIDSDYYHTGYEAAKQGEKISDNPYAKELWGHDQWNLGFKAFTK